MLAESSVLDKPQIVLICGNGSGTASNSLEVSIRNAAYGLDSAEKSRAHTVTSCYVLGSAFSEEHRVCTKFLSQSNGIEIV